MNIKDVSKEDLPREKLLNHGTKILTKKELIALILGKGTKNKNVLKLAEEITKKSNLKNDPMLIHNLKKIDGIGFCKAAQITAAIELGKRCTEEKILQGEAIITPEAAYYAIKNEINDSDQEKFAVIYLDTRNCLICKKIMFIGTIDKQIVSSREITKTALATNATNIIIAHNHPSGNLIPSDADIRTTKRIRDALDFFDIELNDHIITTANGFLSFKQQNLL